MHTSEPLFSPDAPLEESLNPPHRKPRDKRNGQDDDEGQEPKKSVFPYFHRSLNRKKSANCKLLENI